MTIVLAGGSGFLGSALQARLRHAGHQVRTLTRRPPRTGDQVQWQPDGTAGNWAHALDGAAAVVNLAGESVADGRWTPARKAALRNSRLLPTRSLVAAIGRSAAPPPVFINASAVGYYGDGGDALITEATPPGRDFLAELAIDWEREAEQASDVTRVVLVRTGVVLSPEGGALVPMLRLFRLGLGGRFGAGNQYWPWIHLDDWTRLAQWLIDTPAARGAFNGTAPHPVTNAEFTRALAAAVRRPALLPAPAFGLRIALGEFAESLLGGQRAVPARALELGFTFRFERVDEALRDLLS